MPNEHRNPSQAERDERITLDPLDAETALRALLKVKPDDVSPEPHEDGEHRRDDKADAQQ